MTDTVSTTGRIRATIEIDWDHSFGPKANAEDIYRTVARECQNAMESAFRDAKVRFRIIGEVEPLMVIYPCKRP